MTGHDSGRACRKFREKNGGADAINAAGTEMSPAYGKRRVLSAESSADRLQQPGFVLHSHMYRESSLVVDVFTRDYGRVALLAKGAKRPASRWPGVLQTFQPLSISWSGKSELRTLTSGRVDSAA